MSTSPPTELVGSMSLATSEPNTGSAEEPSLDSAEEPNPDPAEEPNPDPAKEPIPDPAEEPNLDSAEEPTRGSAGEPDSDSDKEYSPDSAKEPNPDSTEVPHPDSAEEPTPDSAEEPTPSSPEEPTPNSAEEPSPDSAEAPSPNSTEVPNPASAEEPNLDAIEFPSGNANNSTANKTAEIVLDWILDLMVKNFRRYRRPILASEYLEHYEGREGNYGFDVHDPLNMAVPTEGGGSLELVQYDSVIHNIPFLTARQDTIPGLPQWFPVMTASLLRSWLILRSDMGIQTYLSTIADFIDAPFAVQVGAVARFRIRKHKFTPPRLPRCQVRLSWGESWKEIEVGVVKMLGGEDVQIVSFTHNFAKEGSAKFKQICTKIRRARDGRLLDQDYFQVWSHKPHYGNLSLSASDLRTVVAYAEPNAEPDPQPELDLDDPPEFASDASSASSDDTATPSRPNVERILWAYRPLDFTDVEGRGPFNTDIWHKFKYDDLRELVNRWGVRGVLLIPASQRVSFRRLCRRSQVVARPFVPCGNHRIALRGSYLYGVLSRGFFASEPTNAPPAPRSDAERVVRAVPFLAMMAPANFVVEMGPPDQQSTEVAEETAQPEQETNQVEPETSQAEPEANQAEPETNQSETGPGMFEQD
ncbi:hypothetical protein F5Y14DRAFT_17569 [Nemania sp. NC0429]|nr:hypothetical protein F5Y14DRAFT_17569 [Nemania sp. NC0429]